MYGYLLHLFIAVLFVIAKDWKHPKYPTIKGDLGK